MGEPAEQITPQNSHGSGARIGEPGAGKPFQKGKSGNPSGRPKGLARKVRETLGDDDGAAIAGFWAACMSGVLVTNENVLDANGEPTGATRRVEEKVAMSDRIAVSKLLAERGWGKPPQFAPIEDEDPLDFSEREADELAADFDGKINELQARREAKAAAAAAAAGK